MKLAGKRFALILNSQKYGLTLPDSDDEALLAFTLCAHLAQFAALSGWYDARIEVQDGTNWRVEVLPRHSNASHQLFATAAVIWGMKFP